MIGLKESEELLFGLESMYEHCRFVMEEMMYGDKPWDEKTFNYCEALASECEGFLNKRTYTTNEVNRIREIANEREMLRKER